MNREFKFRAWSAYEKKMHYSHPSGFHEDSKTWAGLHNFFYHYTRHHPDTYYMQWTGLKDKNGKDIYDGDIVEWETSPGSSNIEATRCTDDVRYDVLNQRLVPFINATTEVIGNIYENPYLLTADTAEGDK